MESIIVDICFFGFFLIIVDIYACAGAGVHCHVVMSQCFICDACHNRNCFCRSKHIYSLYMCTCVHSLNVYIYTFRLGTMTPKLNEYVGDICDLFSEECRPRNSKNTAEDCHASRPLVACCWWLRVVYIHYIAKRIYSPIQIIECRCSNHFHGLMCIISSTLVCRLLLQTFVYELVALRSSVNSNMVPW